MTSSRDHREMLYCTCGARFRNILAEAKHRHNFPVLCKKAKERRGIKRHGIENVTLDAIVRHEREAIARGEQLFEILSPSKKEQTP